MKSPFRRRRLWALALSLLAGVAAAQTIPEGRWRCYQPPGYTVLAWFDLDGGGIAVDGHPPRPVAVVGDGLALPAGLLPPWRHAIYFAPGSAQGDAERHTLILLPRAGASRQGRAWERLPRCYLTTH
ncbi:MAG: hypothetical protein HZB40_13465 [Rhodocyclales bacterium]|nr:hypothetical protein [Rhodocyclales bacterium]